MKTAERNIDERVDIQTQRLMVLGCTPIGRRLHCHDSVR